MTLEEIRALNDEERTLQVAKLVGRTKPKGTVWTFPDYATDLNACHEMEEAMSHKDKMLYVAQLSFILSPSRSPQSFRMLHATAKQRCEAFILTRGTDDT